jgi:hypothetical protein
MMTWKGCGEKLALIRVINALFTCDDWGKQRKPQLVEPASRLRGTRQRSWLRHYATSRKDTGSIPDEVIGFFNWTNPSSRTIALGSTQPPTELSTRNLPRNKGRPVRKAENLSAICEYIV